MFKYTDRHDLPGPLLRALQDPYYVEGLNDHFDQFPEELRRKYRENNFSATTLPRSPRQKALNDRHSHRVLLDPLANFWKMMGHVIHSILEKHGDEGAIIEQRLGVELTIGRGYGAKVVYVHGQVDEYNPRTATIRDWKITSAMSMAHPTRREYEAQLNILAHLFRINGFPVEAVENTYLFKDWSSKNVRDDPDHWYPKEQVLTRSVNLWTEEAIESYIIERVSLHMQAKRLADSDLPLCTDEERWMRNPRYKAYKFDPKKGERQVKAKFMTESLEEMNAWLSHPDNAFERAKGPDKKNTDLPDLMKPIKYEVLEQRAKPARCEFCEIAAFCNQRQSELAQDDPEEEEEDG